MISQAQLLRAAFQYLRIKTDENCPRREQKASLLLSELLTLVLLRNRNREISDSYPWMVCDDISQEAETYLERGQGGAVFYRDTGSQILYVSWAGMDRLTEKQGVCSPDDLIFLGHRGMVMEGLAIQDLVDLNEEDAVVVADLIRSYLQQFEIKPS